MKHGFGWEEQIKNARIVGGGLMALHGTTLGGHHMQVPIDRAVETHMTAWKLAITPCQWWIVHVWESNPSSANIADTTSPA